MLTTTLAEIKAHRPCSGGWVKLRKFVGTRKPMSTTVTFLEILESNGIDDAVWALRCAPERLARLYAARCACRVAHLNDDQRIARAIECAALYAEGLADAEELSAASDAVWAAAWAASDAARMAAWAASDAASAASAAWAAKAAASAAARAASDAAWVASDASDAAWAASDATRAAERNWQREEYIRMCNGEGVYAPLAECEEVGRG